jgi:hypothetical protein
MITADMNSHRCIFSKKSEPPPFLAKARRFTSI